MQQALFPSMLDNNSQPFTYIPDYLNVQQQAALMTESSSYPFVKPRIQLYGKSYQIPRSQVWFGDDGCDYLYSSLFIKSQAWPKYANKLRNKLNKDFDTFYNGVLVNLYQDGRDSMGWHSDNEKELVKEADIASISLGASRSFVMRNNSTQQKMQLELHSGDLLIMHAPMQDEWQHALPRRMKVRSPRISYTFRILTPNFHCS